MNNFPKISIITPSYNQGAFIEQTILSVLEQNYPNLEYIIIDGGSTDNTTEIIKKYSKQLTYWVSEKDSGQSEAINKGFAKATGDVINWLNSDDHYVPGALQKVGEAFLKEDMQVFCGRSRVFGKGADYLNNATDIYSGNVNKNIGFARIEQPATFFRRPLLASIGNLNDFLHYVMDKELWMRFLLKYGNEHVVKTDDVLVNYRLHESSKTVSQKNGFREETYNLYYTFAKWASLNEYASFLEKKYPVQKYPLGGYEGLLGKENSEQIINYFFLEQALIYYAQNDFNTAKQFFSAINPLVLREEDRAEINQIKRRMRIPIGLKRIVNQLRRPGGQK